MVVKDFPRSAFSWQATYRLLYELVVNWNNHVLNWNNHVSNIVGKANRSLGFVKRNLNKCPEEVKKQAYYTLVRPNLEYGSSALGPTYQETDQCY